MGCFFFSFFNQKSFCPFLPWSLLAAVEDDSIVAGNIIPLPSVLLDLDTVLVVNMVGLVGVPVGVAPGVPIDP